MSARKQIADSPAEIYDTRFVPALFEHWGPIVVEAADVQPGHRVLDVACGTGAATLAAARQVGSEGHAVGLDASSEMLAVARMKDSGIEWIEGVAEALPMPDGHFDTVISQFGLMFFQNKTKALREIMRVLRAGGKMAVAVCDSVENSPGYDAFAKLLDDLFGKQLGDAFRAPFALGNEGLLQALCRDAEIASAEVSRHHSAVRFDSIDALVSAERACAWTLGGLLDDEQFARLLTQSRHALQPFVTESGIRFDMPALIVFARKGEG